MKLSYQSLEEMFSCRLEDYREHIANFISEKDDISLKKMKETREALTEIAYAAKLAAADTGCKASEVIAAWAGDGGGFSGGGATGEW